MRPFLQAWAIAQLPARGAPADRVHAVKHPAGAPDVIHVNLARGFRGGERQTELLVRALANDGIRQRLVYRRGEPLGERLRDLDSLDCIGIGKPFVRHAHRLRGGIVHAHDGKGAHFAHASWRVFGTPYLITRRVDNRPSRSVFTRAMFHRAARVVVLSRAIARVLVDAMPEIVTTVIPSAAADLRINRESVAMLRHQWGGAFVVGQVGALDDSQKGQYDTLAAAHGLLNRSSDWRFVFVGEGKDASGLRAAARRCDQIRFTGRVENVGDYLSAFDVFVFPSRHEGLGSTLLDAMQAGCPIVASDVDGIPELIEHEVNGLLVAPGTPTELESAIARLRASPELCRRLADNARATVSRYTVAAMAAQYMALYAELGVDVSPR